MTNDQREIRRKLRILEHAQISGDVSRACRYFGIGRASFHRWRQAYQAKGEAGLANKRSVPHNHPNKTPDEVVEKVLHLRSQYHLGPMRIVWVTWRAITASRSQTLAFIGSYAAMA
jgi:transposase